MIWLVLVGCPGPTDDTDLEPASPWHVAADQLPGGMLLSAAALGDEVLIVGGDLGGGAGSLLRWTPSALCFEENVADQALWWIDGREEDWYAVGAAGTIVHHTPTGRVDESVSTSSTLYGVYVEGDRVWAVGGDPWEHNLGEIWLREDGTWSLFRDGLPGVLFKVHAGWFVGDGLAYELDGDALIERHPPNGERLLTVRKRAEGDVWAVGGLTQPEILHWTGAAWELVATDPACVSQPLNGVFPAAEGGDVWVAGHFGTMARRSSDGSWDCPSPPVTSEHFHAVFASGDEVLWVGGNLFSSGNNYGTIGRHASAPVDPQAQPCP